MRFFYIDPGLISNSGHHATLCRRITQELKSRGIETLIFGHKDIEPALRLELEATPHFRLYTYWETDQDWLSGWLNAFDVSAFITGEDFANLPAPHADDVVYLSSARPAQLMALGRWLHGLSLTSAPRIFVELGTEPGAKIEAAPDGPALMVPEVMVDSRPFLYRFAAKQLAKIDYARLSLITFDGTCSLIYRELLERDVGILPWPLGTQTRIRSRIRKRPITISFIGHQRGDKGYPFVPAIIEALLSKRTDIKILVHNSAPTLLPDTQESIRHLGAKYSQVTVDERGVDNETWHQLLEASDLIVCPYSRQRYAWAHSGIVSEALAYGIPIVVPANTVLAQTLSDFGEPGTAFSEETSEAILAAIERALDHFDELAARAMGAAKLWNRRHSPKAFIDELLQSSLYSDSQDLAAGLIFLRAGRFERASAIFEGLLSADPNDANVIHFFGAAEVGAGRTDRGIELLRRALELDSKSVSVLSNLGSALCKKGKFDEAKNYFRKVISARPNSAAPYYNLANAYQSLGEWEEALTCYLKALELTRPFDASNLETDTN